MEHGRLDGPVEGEITMMPMHICMVSFDEEHHLPKKLMISFKSDDAPYGAPRQATVMTDWNQVSSVMTAMYTMCTAEWGPMPPEVEAEAGKMAAEFMASRRAFHG